MRDRLDRQHRQLLAALAAAPERIVSFPRGDLRRSAARLPSRWLLPSLRVLSGHSGVVTNATHEGALVINETLGTAKVGIMKAGSSHLDQHRRAGWHTYDTVYVPMGWLAKAAERSVVSRCRDLGWPQATTEPIAMPQGGLTEMPGVAIAANAPHAS